MGLTTHNQLLHHWVHFLHSPAYMKCVFFPKPKKYTLHIGLHLKSIISRVAHSVMGETLRPVETKPKAARVGVRFLEGGSEPPSHQLEGLWSAVSSSSGVRGREFGFCCILGPQKSRQNGQLGRFWNWGTTSESGPFWGHVLPPAPM